MTFERARRLALQHGGRLAWGLWTVAVGLTGIGLVFLALNSGVERPESIGSVGSAGLDALGSAAMLAFPTVGVLIATRQPANAIGWLFLATGVLAGLEDVLLGYATHALLADPGSLPAGAAIGVLADVLWMPTLVCGITFLFLLFPDGRLPAAGWRALVWFTLALAVGYAAGKIALPGPIHSFDDVVNPFGVEALRDFAQVVVDIGGGLVLPTGIAAMIALGVRFRRSGREARQQIKWLFLLAAVFAPLTPLLVVMSEADLQVGGVLASDVLFTLALSAIPLCVGVAILRYRLYDVDVVINRTLVYAALTAILAGAYFGCVLLFQLALGPLTEDNGLAIAGSTLAVAALFRPARARIQAAVDQRFYRRRYDAQRTLEAFTARLRDELDLDALGADVRAVVQDTVQPAHVSLWLRGSR
ncbi:MAG: hypothetical protein M3N56_17090 [Actinomycetota bacterium]|nr:hypothetical protein [Actinomycetota bacterium]